MKRYELAVYDLSAAKMVECNDSTYILYADHLAALPRWRPISEAPKDGTMVDLWCVEPEERAEEYDRKPLRVRLTDCAWHEADEIFHHTGWIRWCDDGNWDLVEGPPMCELGLPQWIPTHYMPLPAGPGEE